MVSPYIKAALVTVALTLFGFFVIGQLDAMRAAELRASVDDLLVQSESERLLYTYAQVMGNDSGALCDFVSTSSESQSSRTYALSEKIRYYEQSNLLNADYQRIKDEYYVSNAALYLNARAMAKYCGTTPYRTVLFFYRVNSDCPECRAQGGILDTIVSTHDNVRVFAFPADSNLSFVRLLVKHNNIRAVPSVVIDDSTVLSGLQSEEQLNKYLGKQNAS